MKRPMLAVAGLYLAGILFSDWWSLPWSWLLLGAMGAALVSLISGIFAPRWEWTRERDWRGRFVAATESIALMLALFLAGAANQARHTAVISPSDLRRVMGNESAIVTLRGRITGVVSEKSFGNATLVRVALDVERVLRNEQWLVASGRVMLQTPGPLDERIFSGRLMEVDGVLAPPPRSRAPGLFDYRQYLQRRGIHFILRLDEHSRWTFLDEHLSPRKRWVDRFDDWARATLTRGLADEEEVNDLLCAMVLGWRTVQSDEMAEPFMRSGTMHIFAVSGLNIVFVTGFLVALLCVCRLPQRWVGIVAVPVLWFYTAATDWQPSAVRATTMMTVVLCAWALARPIDMLNSAGVAAFLILLVDPQQLFHVGFQLSFVVVLGLILIMPPLTTWLEGWLSPDPLLPRSLWPLRWRWGQSPLRWVALLVATSVVAWLASAPLSAAYFHLFTPVSLLANLLVVPLASLVIATSMGSLLVGALWPGVAELFNNAGWLFMKWILGISEWAAALPSAYQYVRGPDAWMVVLAYIVLFGVGAGWVFERRIRPWAIGMAVLSLIAILWQVRMEGQVVRITLLPDGPAIYQEPFSNADGLLVDTGDEAATRMVVLRYIRTRGVDSLPQMLLTHGVKHHVGGLAQIVTNAPVREAFLNPANSQTAAGREAHRLLVDQGVRERFVAAGDVVGAWAILHPARDAKYARSGDGAVVVRGKFQGVRVLLLSDLDAQGQQDLLGSGQDLRADIVVTSMPEYGEALRPAVLAAVNPEIILVHDSAQPVTQRASPALLRRLVQTGIPMFSTRHIGGTRLEISPKGWSLFDSKGQRLAGGQRRHY